MPVIKIKGRWAIDFYSDGRRMRRVIGDGQSKALAVAALHSVKVKEAEGEYLPGKRSDGAKIAEVIDVYWEKYLRFQRGGKQALYCLDRAKEVFGHLKVAGLRKDLIEQFQRSEAARTRKHPVGFVEKTRVTVKGGKEQVEKYKEPVFGKVTPGTVNRITSYLSAAINYCRKIGLIRIPENPCQGVERLPENNTRNRTLTETEYESLQRRLPEYLRPVVAAAYYTAARKGEVLDLRKKDVDLFSGLIHIRDSKNKEARFVPIDPRLKGCLIEAIRQAPESEYLFTFKGRKIKNVKKAFQSACKLAQLGDFHFHDLRHTCMTNWARAGHGHSLIMAASGHKTYSCFKRYVNFKAADLLRLVSGQNGQLVDTREKALVCNVG